MFEQLFDIFFSGQIIEGKDPNQVQQNVGKMFKANEDHLARLFSGKPIKIKSAIDQDTAIKYRLAFRDAGALIEIRTSDPLAAPVAEKKIPQEAAPHAADEITLLPPQTGSLIDCAKEVTPTPLPDISSIQLASPGIDLDETPPAPPANISTDGLILNPANTGSLEDCHIEKEAMVIPDISQIKLTDE